ncbi:helix-turn-helix domain-containing protein [Chitinophaga sp. GCM10012297]|uniref:Helix-turn-helix transcriptional regulator n=1 Tax=Chitinophaga chungangae TaxID=2821488 RepID=A0ABS3YHB0_9BACT|nr:helix-turn-helix transcriptional regulator [Chitinophaga chungangae]MBO9154080.1 helix-turn-helix transcriptional regulator [Chitinophaga chungangae]
MSSFGKKLRECRDAKGLSQSELAKLLNTNHSIIGKYEREEVKPTIDVVKRLAEELETTVGFLLGETKQVNVLKDPAMLKRLNDIDALPETDKQCILYALDGLLRDAKTRAAYSK